MSFELVVEDSFSLAGRGLVLVPWLPFDGFSEGQRLTLALAGDATRVIGACFRRTRVRGATREQSGYFGSIVWDAGTPKLATGTRAVVSVVSG